MSKHRAKKAYARNEGEMFLYKPNGSKAPTGKQWAKHFAMKHPDVVLERRDDGRIICGKRRPPFRESEVGGLDEPGREHRPDIAAESDPLPGPGDAAVPEAGPGT